MSLSSIAAPPAHVGLGRRLPNMRFPDPATHWLHNRLPSLGGHPGMGAGGGGFLANLAPGSRRKIPKGLK